MTTAPAALYTTEIVDPLFITLADGTRLAATLYRPKSAGRYPAILEAVPYRRRDGTIFRDREMDPYYAEQGFAYVRLDLRGSGDSEGLLSDEYSEQELEDLCEVIAWIAQQDWCDGAVGMTGISWGGFNALQVAARRPPALKAIITIGFTDDRYHDDVHYFGGCLLSEDPLWSAFMLALQGLPPDPQIVGAAWRDLWRQRLAANRSWSERWIAHQARDAYWQRASICEDFDAIAIPVYAISGWDDTYANAVPRTLAGLKGPRKGLIGPWAHGYPCRGSPGPLIGYLQEATRWWRHWLKGEETGIMDEPMLRVWMQEPEKPAPFYLHHPGRWVAEESWPSPRIETQSFYLNSSGLGERPMAGERLTVTSPVMAGANCGRYGGYGGTSPDLPPDQGEEDARALSFESAPLAEDWELLGEPLVELDGVIGDVPRINLTARLCSVAPDGSSHLIDWGSLNLTQRESRAHPSPLVPGQVFKVTLALKNMARRIPAGHRLRLSLATQHWPILWPQPWNGSLTLPSGRCVLKLPRRPLRDADAALPPFEPVYTTPKVPSETLREGGSSRNLDSDPSHGTWRVETLTDYGRERLLETGTITESWVRDQFQIVPGDPLSAKLESRWFYALEASEAVMSLSAVTTLTADQDNFYLSWRLETFERDALVDLNEDRVTIARLWV